MISGLIKVEVSVISRSRRLRLITLTEAFIISDSTKPESNNCFIIYCLKKITTNALLHRTQLIFDKPCSYFAVRELDITLGNHAFATTCGLFTNLLTDVENVGSAVMGLSQIITVLSIEELNI